MKLGVGSYSGLIKIYLVPSPILNVPFKLDQCIPLIIEDEDEEKKKYEKVLV